MKLVIFYALAGEPFKVGGKVFVGECVYVAWIIEIIPLFIFKITMLLYERKAVIRRYTYSHDKLLTVGCVLADFQDQL